MDAFSFALSVGSFNIKEGSAVKLSLLIGAFHFFMPILGSIIGSIFKKILSVNFNIITGIIFLFIAAEMIKEYKKEEEKCLELTKMLVVALSVSIDSFAVGFTLTSPLINRIYIATIFTIFSGILTYVGLHIGKAINKYIGQISKTLGILIMLFLAFSSFVKS